MTTIAWTPGCFAADSCITHSDENAMPGHRSFARKLFIHHFEPDRRARALAIAVASKGDSAAAAALNDLVLEQGKVILTSRSRSEFAKAMNQASLLKKRREIIGDKEIGQLLTVWRQDEDVCYEISENGLVVPIDEPYYAIGWDSGIAYGSLRAGKDALFAVESAACYGCYTAKPIHYLTRSPNGIVLRTAT